MTDYGINLLVWSGQLGAEEMQLLPRIRDLGYTSVELPIFDPSRVDIEMIRDALAASGLACTVSTTMPSGVNLLDAATTPAGLAFLETIIRYAARLGAPLVCGPFVVPVGELRGRGYLPAEWQQCVIALRQAGDLAANAGVVLALEPLNRFETFFVNTTADAVRLMDEVNHPAVGLLLDTFHMHIEEKSTVAAIHHAGRHIRHFHLSENDRGIVGSGQIAWQEVLNALETVGYTGALTVESFSAVIPELAAATCIWRPLAPSADALARESLAFVARLVEARLKADSPPSL
jgi:D-psicose/D-tagatose/L-ribulose 3-epimerase